MNEEDVREAKEHMAKKIHHGHYHLEDDSAEEWKGETWGMDDIQRYRRNKSGRCVILVQGFIVDVTRYLGEHVGLYRRRVFKQLMDPFSPEEQHCYGVTALA